jgi:uncharacterized protein (TIGR00661 family)
MANALGALYWAVVKRGLSAHVTSAKTALALVEASRGIYAHLTRMRDAAKSRLRGLCVKILYGVQGTGNGHISRANAMAEAFAAHPELEISWLLSGRDREQGCGAIETFDWRRGLTFVTGDGGINKFATFKKNSLMLFWKDVTALDLSPYDLVISDYEPVICYAAWRKGIPVTGISHLYAFNYPVPMRGGNPFTTTILRRFAPVSQPIGLHWHHFGHPILPPILDVHKPATMPAIVRNKVVVYLPWENAERVVAMLTPFPDYEFYIYHPSFSNADSGNLHRRAISRHGFKQDLFDAWGVIANCGFELISECLYLGKRVLTKPLSGQMEQYSNAAALEQLGYADTMTTLDPDKARQWLRSDATAVLLEFPNVARELAAWIAGGRKETLEELAGKMWMEM